MNKLFSTLFAVVFATSLMAQSGLTCNDPIPVDSNYVGTVDGPCELWYSASTYDLPLNVHFIPEADDSEWWPEVVIDLTCEPGVYDDPKIDSIIKMAEGFDITFPVELACDRVVKNGKVEWDLFVDAMYREQLAEFGVTYNVTAYVKVYFQEAGTISLKPDTTFSSCMDNAEHVVLDDSIAISANDSSRVFVLPYTDWQNDSIQFVWTGAKPAYVYMASGQCDFLPSTASGYVWDCYVVNPGEPFKLSNKAIKDAITQNAGGGLFYGKVLSATAGQLVVEKIPMAAIQGGAILLEYGKTVQLPANATDALYCFPKTWGPTQFWASTYKAVTMYLAHSANFQASADDANVVAAIPFSSEGDERALYLSTKELETYMTGLVDDYVYVRFVSDKPMSITPDAWDASVCSDASISIVPNTEFLIAARSGNTIYRMRYDDFAGYPFKIKWTGSGSLPVYISDTCHYVLSSTNAHVLKYSSIRSGNTSSVDSATLASWEVRAEDGYFYVRFNSTNKGRVTFITEKPEEEPEPLSPCLQASVKLNVGDELKLSLASAFTVYAIDYNAWMQQAVTLEWTGIEPLHTFVAETCEFALAPYNRYVHAYVPVPAQGDWVLDMNALAPYVDEDGYLYVRFLTEFEGTLKVGQ